MLALRKPEIIRPRPALASERLEWSKVITHGDLWVALYFIEHEPQGFNLPSIVFDGSSSTGGVINTSGTIAGDFAVHMATTETTTPSTVPSGFTAYGAGIGSDESATDCSIRCSGKFLTSANEQIGSPGTTGTGARVIGVVFRQVDPAILAGMPSIGTSSAGQFTYDATTGANWVVPAVTPTRACAILAFGRRGGAEDTDFTDLTLIRRVQSANHPGQAYWTAAAVASFAGYSYAITSTAARAACVTCLYGLEAA